MLVLLKIDFWKVKFGFFFYRSGVLSLLAIDLFTCFQETSQRKAVTMLPLRASVISDQIKTANRMTNKTLNLKESKRVIRLVYSYQLFLLLIVS